MEGPVRFLRRADFGGFASGVDKAVSRGTLLKVQNEAGEFFFLNSPRGRVSVEAIQSGRFDPSNVQNAPPVERSNIFKLYEENIGALTPLIADMLREAEKEYPSMVRGGLRDRGGEERASLEICGSGFKTVEGKRER